MEIGFDVSENSKDYDSNWKREKKNCRRLMVAN
jgi:hypothetical protein